MNKPVQGDQYEWHGITITVKEVDPERRWAMIHCVTIRETWDHHTRKKEWEKQQVTPDGTFPEDWIKISQ